jgi:hypothetical protein
MPPDQPAQSEPGPAWAAAITAFAALETALKAATVESGSMADFRIATGHLHKITDMRTRFAARRPVVERTAKEG